MASTTTRLTIEDFERLPDEEARGHELVDGELVDVSGNNPKHNRIRAYLIAQLWPLVTKQKLGCVLDEQEFDFGGNAHGPDISFFGRDKLALVEDKKRVQRFVPDFAVEIVSPNNTFESLVQKKDRYRRCGTAEVWLISPEDRSVYTYSDDRRAILAGNDELSTPLIPGFSITVEDLFNGA
jgi:Uma2 family endonuclease